jgi:predicted DNA-binding protein with PD1-like motif
MEYRRVQDILIIRLDEGEKVVESLTTICLREGVRSGVVLSFVGAVKELELILRKGHQETFGEHFEITGNGNISMLDGRPRVHIHVVGGNETKVKAGHLVEGTATVFCEIIVKVLEGFKMERRLVEELSMEKVQFPYRLTP